MWTAIYFLKRLVFDIVYAVRFGVVDYDQKLRLTKTTQERIIIWIVIGTFSLIGLYILSQIIGNIFLSFTNFSDEVVPDISK